LCRCQRRARILCTMQLLRRCQRAGKNLLPRALAAHVQVPAG
jgi:hypothetical protein